MKNSKTVHWIGLLLVGLAFSACTRCVNCSDCPAGVSLNSEQICEDDFNNKEAFDRQVQLNEGYGCTCTEE